MHKHNLLFGLVGLVIGVAVGYFATQSINKNVPASSNEAAPSAQMPAGGPPPVVLEMLKKASDEPDNFDAQMQVAALYQQIGRTEKSIEFLQRAARLKPTDETALLTLTQLLLEKGEQAEAQKTFQQLEKIKPTTPELKQQRDDVRKKLSAAK